MCEQVLRFKGGKNGRNVKISKIQATHLLFLHRNRKRSTSCIWRGHLFWVVQREDDSEAVTYNI